MENHFTISQTPETQVIDLCDWDKDHTLFKTHNTSLDLSESKRKQRKTKHDDDDDNDDVIDLCENQETLDSIESDFSDPIDVSSKDNVYTPLSSLLGKRKYKSSTDCENTHRVNLGDVTSTRKTVIAFDIGIKTLSWIIMSASDMLDSVEIHVWKTQDILCYLDRSNNNVNVSNNDRDDILNCIFDTSDRKAYPIRPKKTTRVKANTVSNIELIQCCVDVMYDQIIPTLVRYPVDYFVPEMQPNLQAQFSQKMHTIAYTLAGVYRSWLHQERCRIQETLLNLSIKTPEYINAIYLNTITETQQQQNMHQNTNIITSLRTSVVDRGNDRGSMGCHLDTIVTQCIQNNNVGENGMFCVQNAITALRHDTRICSVLRGAVVVMQNADNKLMKVNRKNDGDDDDDHDDDKRCKNGKKYQKKKIQSVERCALFLGRYMPRFSRWLVEFESWKNKRDRADAFWHAIYRIFYRDPECSRKQTQQELETLLGIHGNNTLENNHKKSGRK